MNKIQNSQSMKFILYSQTNEKTIAQNAGKPEYSYYYILKSYLPILETLGDVEIVYEPTQDVDRIYDQCQTRGQPCVFLHFTAPQNHIPSIRCPTIHVIAWEYSTIPSETWDDNPYNDWRLGLSNSIGALSISRYTVDTVKKALGDDYDAAFAPCAIWDGMARLRSLSPFDTPIKDAEIKFDGVLIDSRHVDLSISLPSDEEIADKKMKGDVQMLLMEHKNAFINQSVERVKQYANLLQVDFLDKGARIKAGRTAILKGAVKAFISDIKLAFDQDQQARCLEATRPAEEFRLAYGSNTSDLPKVEVGPERETVHSLSDIAKQEFDDPPVIESDPELGEELVKDATGQNSLRLKGVVYSAILNPYDGRKNWQEMVIAFCWAFRDISDATLVIKITAEHIVQFSDELIFYFKRLAPFKCRVVIVHAYLDETAYDQFLLATTYFVNTSYGEGQSIPLTEAMSAGIPAVAPNHTAMQDYVFDDAAFVFKTDKECTSWQHDPRQAFRCYQYRPDWDDLVGAFRKSYDVAKREPAKYSEMGKRAITRLETHCSISATTKRMREYFEQPSIFRKASGITTAAADT
ncbi:MAG: glycosyltransferase [Pseudomonadota bacterium]